MVKHKSGCDWEGVHFSVRENNPGGRPDKQLTIDAKGILYVPNTSSVRDQRMTFVFCPRCGVKLR